MTTTTTTVMAMVLMVMVMVMMMTDDDGGDDNEDPETKLGSPLSLTPSTDSLEDRRVHSKTVRKTRPIDF